jgi:hypothetical protein
MPSPLPGMDPYLESETLWPTFQHQFVLTLSDMLTPGLAARYHAQVGQRSYSLAGNQNGSPEPRECQEEYLEIQTKEDNRLVTLLEIASPSNKTSASGREAYLKTRRLARSAKANVIEIDLVIQGQPLLEYSRQGLPQWDYAATVTRAAKPEQHEIYTTTLQKRLPRCRLPLAASDRDLVLDLQAAFQRCYDEGGFAAKIDYKVDPTVLLSQENRQWLDDLLKAQKLRGQVEEPVSQEKIASVAYSLWQQAGCPHGRDQEFWQSAEQLVREEQTGPKH